MKTGLPYWLDWDRPGFPGLNGKLTADVTIIGAGIVGLKIAYYLSQHGMSVVVLEGQRVGQGASGRNQGSINHGGAMTYKVGIDRFGRAGARSIWRLGQENQRRLRQQIELFAIDCDYQVDGFAYLVLSGMADDEATMLGYKKDFELLSADGFDVEFVDAQTGRSLSGSPNCRGGLRYRSDAQFHAGKYVVGLAQAIAQLPGVRLFEQSRVQHVSAANGTTLVGTAGGEISCQAVALTVNALAPQWVPGLATGLRAERGQVFVTEKLAQRPCRGSFAAGLGWWREIVEADGTFRLLFGGARQRDEPDSLFPQFTASGQPHPLLETEGFSPSRDHQKRLDDHFARTFPQLVGVKISHRWGGLQSFVADSLPQIGLFDPARRLYGIAGLCGRGNCYSDVAAAYLAEQISGVSSGLSVENKEVMAHYMAVNRPAAQWPAWHSLYNGEA